MSRAVVRVPEGEPIPDGCVVDRILATEEVPYGTGTASRRVYTLLVTDTRYWLTDAEKRESPVGRSMS